MNVTLDPSMLAAERFAIGQPVSRKEDPVLPRGEGRHTDDLNRPDQLHAVMVRGRGRRIGHYLEVTADAGTDRGSGIMDLAEQRPRPAADAPHAGMAIGNVCNETLAGRRDGHLRDL